MSRPITIARGVLATFLLLAPTSAAQAGQPPIPWSGSATGTTTPGAGGASGPHIDAFTGWSTYLGWFKGAGSHVLDVTTGAVQGSATWTAVGGDALRVVYSANVTPSGNPVYPYAFKGVLQVVGGTGRLSRAIGISHTWQGAFTGVPGELFFTFEGVLNAPNVAPSTNFTFDGKVAFANLVEGVKPGAIVPYYGVGISPLLGNVVETGSIQNTTGLIPIDAATFMFLGKVGPNLNLPGTPAIHRINTKNGYVDSTWTAIFTLKVVNARGDAVFSGDGYFPVIGGTGKYAHASGRFRTVFSTDVVPFGSDQAVAGVRQCGQINR